VRRQDVNPRLASRHSVIPSVNFPAIKNPHVEVYVGWNKRYHPRPSTAATSSRKPVGLIPTGDISLHLDCIDYGTAAKATATVPGGVSPTRGRRD
jgi:hypothetical protein